MGEYPPYGSVDRSPKGTYEPPRGREEREEKLPSGATVVRGTAPEAGTALTPERMARNLGNLNSPWSQARRDAPRTPESPDPEAPEDGAGDSGAKSPTITSKLAASHSRTPRRKPLAFLGGGGVGGHVAIILAFYLPDYPPEVISAFAVLLVLALGFVSSYLVASED